jgi:CheY-like chemotaxis protein
MPLPNSPRRILVVDDNRDAADLTAELFTLCGYAAKVAYGGRQGIDTATAFLPDVVFLDLGMPEVDGFAVAAALRHIPALAQARLIAYTAWSDAATRQRVLACGFDQHLVKPASFEALQRAATPTRPAV